MRHYMIAVIARETSIKNGKGIVSYPTGPYCINFQWKALKSAETEDDSEAGWNSIVFLAVKQYNSIDVEKKLYFKIIACKIWIFKKII